SRRFMIRSGRASCTFLLLTAACGGGDAPASAGSAPGAAAGDPAILRVAYTREIDVLNPFTSQNLVDIQFSMMEGLVTTDEHNTYIPVLAREIPTEDNGGVTLNGDGTVDMTWHLREGVRWHDGEPFTSADVCFTWRFVSSPGSQTYNRDQYLNIVDCTMPDAHTVVFHWNGLYGYYAGLFEAVLPEHVLGDMTTEEIVNYEPYNRGSGTIGTGPFRFVEWKTGEYIHVERNPDYWRGDDVPALAGIVWSFIPDNNTRLNALKAGGFHWGQIQPTQVAEMEGVDGMRVHLVPSNSVMHLDLNVKTERGQRLFADADVRRALFHAIDREAIARQLLQGTVRVTNSPINPTSPYHNADAPGFDYDPERSRRLLDAAGWTPGPDGIRTKGGERFSFTLLNRAGSTDRIAIAQVIQAQLRQVGVEVQFETLESAAWTQRWRSSQWEGIISAWFLPADPSITGLYACGGPNNMTGFCDPALDEVMEESDRHLSFAQRKPLLDRAQTLLGESAHTLLLYHNVIPEVVSERVQGYRGSGTNFGSFWNLHEWSLGPPAS
ncbi:MAG: peptide ABC transporter substrate-binding protein, partial [Gemmatimonadetes bacterium]|nr:peptide ABC transporter substrate-binding protein [Gemmatimonadota bacterium]